MTGQERTMDERRSEKTALGWWLSWRASGGAPIFTSRGERDHSRAAYLAGFERAAALAEHEAEFVRKDAALRRIEAMAANRMQGPDGYYSIACEARAALSGGAPDCAICRCPEKVHDDGHDTDGNHRIVATCYGRQAGYPCSDDPYHSFKAASGEEEANE